MYSRKTAKQFSKIETADKVFNPGTNMVYFILDDSIKPNKT